MKVFLSWSGTESKAVATALRDWMQDNLQRLDPWMSESDLEPGQGWFDQIVKALTASSVGVFCITRDTLTSPFLHFEAGFIAAKGNGANVHALLVGLEPSELKGPLSSLQVTRFDRSSVLRMISSINGISPKPLDDETLDRVFDRTWKSLELAVTNALVWDAAGAANTLLNAGRISAHTPTRAKTGVSQVFVLSVIEQNLTTGEVQYRRVEPGEWNEAMEARRNGALGIARG